MSRQTVLLLFGGKSSEHDVSLKSARNIYAAMDGEKYEVLLGYIDRRGKWWLLESWHDDLEHHGGSQLVAALGMRSFITLPGNTVVHPDVLFPVLHGLNGEDGTVQGLAQLLDIPIVGCDTTASAVCMDKVITKQIAQSIGIATAPWRLIVRGDAVPSHDELVRQLGETLFVKPARSGSSFGVSKVMSADEYRPALNEAFRYGRRVVVEAALDGRELETAVLGNPPEHEVGGIGEIVPGRDFYDYEDKYADDSASQTSTTVDLDDALCETIRSTSHKLYQELGCSGLARIDYMLVDDTPYIMEINTLPGFTNISMYPQLWRASGVHYPQLIDRLIAAATE